MRILRAIFGHTSGRIGGAIVLLYLVIALLGLMGFTPHDPLMQNRLDRLHSPTITYWMSPAVSCAG